MCQYPYIKTCSCCSPRPAWTRPRRMTWYRCHQVLVRSTCDRQFVKSGYSRFQGSPSVVKIASDSVSPAEPIVIPVHVPVRRPSIPVGKGSAPKATPSPDGFYVSYQVPGIMAVPKRRTSKRKKRARNTHKTAPAIVIQTCPQCSAMKRPHHVCAECGYYAGEQRVAPQEA